MMTKPKRVECHEYYHVKEFKRQGRYLGFDFPEYGPNEPAHFLKLRCLFAGATFVSNDPDDVEETLFYLSDACEIGFNEFQMPLPGRDEDMLVAFSDDIEIHLNCSDSYHGHSESETYLKLEGFILKKDVSAKQMQAVLQWLHDIFTGTEAA